MKNTNRQTQVEVVKDKDRPRVGSDLKHLHNFFCRMRRVGMREDDLIGLSGLEDGNCELLLAMCRGLVEVKLPDDIVNLDSLCLGLSGMYETCTIIRDFRLGMHHCTKGEREEIRVGDKTLIISDISGRRLVGNVRFDDTMTLDGRGSDHYIRLNSAAAEWMSRSSLVRKLLGTLPTGFRVLFLGTVWKKESSILPRGYSPFEVPGVFVDCLYGTHCERVPIPIKLPDKTYTAILV